MRTGWSKPGWRRTRRGSNRRGRQLENIEFDFAAADGPPDLPDKPRDRRDDDSKKDKLLLPRRRWK